MTTRPTPLQEYLKYLQARGLDAYAGREEDYFVDFTVDVLQTRIPSIEAAKHKLGDMSEDAITHDMFDALRLQYPGLVLWGNHGGECDVLLSIPHAGFFWAGEAKITYDFARYDSGLTKLVGKYSSGRTTNALMLGYCKDDGMYPTMAEFKNRIVAEKTAFYVRDVASVRTELRHKSVFQTIHLAAGREITVTHAWVNMHYVSDVQREADARNFAAVELKAAGMPARPEKKKRGPRKRALMERVVLPVAGCA